MTRTIRGMALAVAMLATAGHARAAEFPADPGTLTFSSTQSQESGQEITATGASGAIRFQGSLQTGTPCFNVTGSLRESENRIVVTVTAEPTDGMCTQVITYNNYSGEVSGLAAGTYEFQIVHGAGDQAETVLSERITVR